MRYAILLSFVASGLMFGHDHKPNKISGDERIALETSSPRVHVAKKNSEDKGKRADRVVTDKTTINAFVPMGK